jgi:hypothetical protein
VRCFTPVADVFDDVDDGEIDLAKRTNQGKMFNHH